LTADFWPPQVWHTCDNPWSRAAWRQPICLWQDPGEFQQH